MSKWKTKLMCAQVFEIPHLKPDERFEFRIVKAGPVPVRINIHLKESIMDFPRTVPQGKDDIIAFTTSFSDGSTKPFAGTVGDATGMNVTTTDNPGEFRFHLVEDTGSVTLTEGDQSLGVTLNRAAVTATSIVGGDDQFVDPL